MHHLVSIFSYTAIMNPELIVKNIWERAKHILLPYDGTATEIFITDLSIGSLTTSIEAIESAVSFAEILSCAGESLETPELLTSESKNQLLVTPATSTQHSIRCTLFSERDICFYIWVEPVKGTHEIEIVFWNDLSFPEDHSISEHIKAFSVLVALAERIRGSSVASKCILSGEHNGPTEELLANERSIIW
jgi:hypothetical protein